MPKRSKPNILITIDGLFLFYFDEKNKRCEIKIHTAAQGHRMKIEIKDSNSKIVKTFKQGEIKSLHPLSLFIGAGDEPRPTPNSAIALSSFGEILDLSGSNFYGRSLEIKRGKYDASIFLNNGVIEAGNMSKCHRVKEKFFDMLDFNKITKADWDALVREARKKDIDSITNSITFAGEVIATIDLKKDQKFWITHGRKNEKLFEPLEPGKNYEVLVKYSDIKKPVSFADCLGFAHHCKALKLEKKETVFGIFGPRIINGFGPITPGGCCRCARISLPINATGSIKTKGKRG